MAKGKFERTKPHVNVGTIGHVDHGKTTLTAAMTHILAKKFGGEAKNYDQIDAAPEEKARGITIDLGFAHTTEDDVVLSFVDVPGHERFVRNMLAGVGGMDLVMLHVAADESVMPQTQEHFDICRLLQVPAGLVVLTKSDLADRGMRDVVRLEVQELVSGSFLDGAPIVEVSARTGEGVAELEGVLGGDEDVVHRGPDQAVHVGDEELSVAHGHLAVQRRGARVGQAAVGLAPGIEALA